MKRINSLLLTAIIALSLIITPSLKADFLSSYKFMEYGHEAMNTIESHFGRSDPLYSQSTTNYNPEYAWGQGIMFSALVAAAKVDSSYMEQAKNHADEIRRQYWRTCNGFSGFNAGTNACGDRYTDDNAWIALALMELYEISNETKYLDWAKETMVFIMAYENGPTDTPNGGIKWHETTTCGANVCSTAPACLTNLMIYQASGEQKYLNDGIRLYDWLRTSGVQAQNGLYWQSINCNLGIDYGFLGYETGPPTQAAIKLYRITGDKTYLQEAQRLANAMEKEFIKWDTHELRQSGKWGGHDMTNAYIELYEVDHNPHWLNVVAGYLEFLHDNCKDQSTGLYPTDWNKTDGSYSNSLLDNASVARAYWKMASAFGGSAPDRFRIKNRHTRKCIYPYDSGTNDQTNVVIYTENTDWTSQLWTATDLGNGYFNLISFDAAKSLQPLNNETTTNTETVITNTIATAKSQQWKFTKPTTGYINIQNRLANLSLRPLNSSSVSNTNVIIDTTNTLRSEQWEFINHNMPLSIEYSLSINNAQPQNTNKAILYTGDNITLNVTALTSGTWQWEGPDNFTSTQNEITIQNFTPAKAGYYLAMHSTPDGYNSLIAFNLILKPAVKLYQDCYYDGYEVILGPGLYTTSDLIAAGARDNDISSLTVEPGFSITLYNYNNLTGSSLTRTSDDDCLVNEGWNDLATSILIQDNRSIQTNWKLNENTGTLLYDTSGNNKHAQMFNMAQDSWTRGKKCSGLTFDGINDYAKALTYYGVNNSQSRTCAAWIKTNQPNGTILSWGTPEAGQKWTLRLNDSGNFIVDVNGGSIQSNINLDNNWHHIAVVLHNDETPDISEALLYIDGKLDTNTTVNQFQNINTANTQNLIIAAQYNNGSYSDFFTGTIDEIEIYPYELTSEQINQIYRENVLVGDTEKDGDIDFNDFAVLAKHWQSTSECQIDLNCDCKIDTQDLLILTEQWLDTK